MKIIKTFEQFDEVQLLDTQYEKYLPKKLEVYKGMNDKIIHRSFNIGNIIRNANMTQIIYQAEEILFGHPDEMSIDIYYYKNSKLKLTFDIIYGDLIVSEFSCEPPDDIKVIEYTSYHSKFDPSNTVFALSDNTIQDLCNFINTIDGFKVLPRYFNFLNTKDDYNPSN